MFNTISKGAGTALSATFLALLGASQTWAGTIVTVVSAPPNWALGSPQFATLGGCSDRDNLVNSCGVGISDTLSLQIPTRAAISGVLNENAAGEGPGGLLNNAGAIDLIIPNANWIFPRWFVFQDSPNEGVFASDAVYLINNFGTAHFILISNNSDLDTSQLPSIDVLYPGTSATLGPPTDITSSLDANGNFTITVSNPLVQSQEPSTVLLLLSGIASLAFSRRKPHFS